MPELWKLDENLFRIVHLWVFEHVPTSLVVVLTFTGLGYFHPIAPLAKISFPKLGSLQIALVAWVLMSFLGFFAEKSPLALLSSAILVTCLYGINRRTALGVVISFATSGILRLVIVPWVARERPSNLLFAHPGEQIYGHSSFPSGHTTTTFAVALSMLLLQSDLPRWQKSLLWIWGPIVACSRSGLGVHYPLDTIAGALLGAGVAMITVYCFNLWDQRSKISP